MNGQETRKDSYGPTPTIAALLIGLALGVLIAWLVWPVHWIQCDPADLRQEAREEYLLLVAGDYAVTRDANAALARLESWDSLAAAGREIRELADYRRAQGQLDVAQRLDALANGLPLPAAEGGPTGKGVHPFLYVIVVLVVIACLLLFGWLLRLRQAAPKERLRAATRRAASPPLAMEEVEEEEAEEELAPPEERGRHGIRLPWPARGQPPPYLWDFEAVYAGEGIEFDRTFIIEKKDEGKGGEYFGECGMAAAAFVEEHTERVSALEVWLFDKSDIRSEVKVLMSPYAYGDEDTREEMAGKGEPVLARPGTKFALEGHRLRADVRIEEVEYQAQEPAESSFARLAVRLRVSRQEKESSASE